MRTLLCSFTAALLIMAPLAAGAQSYPSYAQGGDAQIRGRITGFDGAYSLRVRDDKGYVDAVRLHQGTIINPTGLTLEPGMVVSILGYNAGPYFAANEVDTPYTYDSGVPYYGGHRWNYYGSGFSLAFFFGNSGWWHGSAFGGSYRYERGVRVYEHVNTAQIYHGGTFHGRIYIAPHTYGGYVHESRPQGHEQPHAMYHTAPQQQHAESHHVESHHVPPAHASTPHGHPDHGHSDRGHPDHGHR
jgi:hypothetical protein